MPKHIHYSIVLTCVCLVSALGLAGTFVLTEGKIQLRKKQKLSKALAEVLPAAKRFETLEPKVQGGDMYVGLDETGKRVGFAVIGDRQGYSSRIQVLVGMEPDLTEPKIIAIDIVDQQETPGLGANIQAESSGKTLWSVLGIAKEREDFPPSFKDQFKGKVVNKLRVGSTIDAITGATISSRAVVAAVRTAGARAQIGLGLAVTIDGATGATAKVAPMAAPVPPEGQPPGPPHG